MKAIYNSKVIAESDEGIHLEGNYYFPPEAVNMEYLKQNSETYTCSSKGDAVYYDVVVGDKTGKSNAWVYKEPLDAVKNIAGYVAFWKDVEII